MASRARAGAALSGTVDDRRTTIDAEIQGRRGTDRGALTSQPLEQLVVGTDLYLAMADIGHLPFILGGIAVQAKNVDGGTLTVGLYRIDIDDILPTRFSALLFQKAALTLPASATFTEYLATFTAEKKMDRVFAAWLVAIMGSTANATVRGTDTYTPPCFRGWMLPAPGALPATIDSRALTRTSIVPSAGVLTQAGTRFRSS